MIERQSRKGRHKTPPREPERVTIDLNPPVKVELPQPTLRAALTNLIETYRREAVHCKSQVEQRLPIRDYAGAFVLANKAERLEITAYHLQDILTQCREETYDQPTTRRLDSPYPPP